MKLIGRFTLVCFLYFVFGKVVAQPCTCHELLTGLITKVESNYAGYIHKVKEHKENKEYLLLKGQLTQKSNSTNYNDCYQLLSQYVRFFNDGHLFIIEIPRITAGQSDSLSQYIKHFDLSEEKLKDFVHQAKTDPLEGVWNDKSQKIAILKNGINSFIGVTLENTNAQWKRGMIKMEIEKVKPNEYNLTIYRNDFAPIRFTQVHIYKNSVLPFGVYRFARESPVSPELNYINNTDPELPVFRQLDTNTCLITVPTALINPAILDSILRSNEQALTTTPNLIIDVRGNLGGNYIWGGLQALTNTKEYPEPKKENEDEFLMLASEDNADYVFGMSTYLRNTKNSAGVAHYDTLIAKLRNFPGEFIGFSFYNSAQGNNKRTVYKFPQQIAILMDKGTASAGEAFVLSVKANSDKVTLYGENTYGMIDYMNTNAKKIPCQGNNSYYYGYPTFFAPSIKTSPVNPTGIKPDIYVSPGTEDWIEWVKLDLSNKKKK